MSFLSDLLNVPKLRAELKELRAEVTRLNEKVAEKQQQINKTNAHWKGVMRNKKTKK